MLGLHVQKQNFQGATNEILYVSHNSSVSVFFL